jgi:hypothetical protein
VVSVGVFALDAEGYAHLLGNANDDDAERSSLIGISTKRCGIWCCGGRVAQYWCLMLRGVASFMRAHQQRMLRGARAWFSTNHMSASSAAPGGLAFDLPPTHLSPPSLLCRAFRVLLLLQLCWLAGSKPSSDYLALAL